MLNPAYRAKLAAKARERRKTDKYKAWYKAYKSREDVKEKNKLRMRKYRQSYAGFWTYKHYFHVNLQLKKRRRDCEVCIRPTDFIAF